MRTLSLPALVGMIALSAAAHAGSRAPITASDVTSAQQAWCDALVRISQTHQQGGDYRKVAADVIDSLYDYQQGQVFFKPTLAFGKNTFRPTREGALAYFVGGNDNFPEDKGFALNNWTKATFVNSASSTGIQVHGDVAITMGHVTLTNGKGETTTVEKTFAFRRDEAGKLRLIVHKSALPFNPSK